MSRHLTSALGLPYYDADDPPDGASQQADLAQTLDTVIGLGGAAPVGSMFMWPGNAAPAGYLLMQGQAVSATTYPGLAAVLGSAGGSVTIPDMRDVFPAGAGATIALGATGGVASVVLAKAHMPVHDHGALTGFTDRLLTHGHVVQTAGTPVGSGQAAYTGITKNSGTFWGETQDANAPDHKHVIAADGGGQGHENRPPFRGVNFIIRAG